MLKASATKWFHTENDLFLIQCFGLLFNYSSMCTNLCKYIFLTKARIRPLNIRTRPDIPATPNPGITNISMASSPNPRMKISIKNCNVYIYIVCSHVWKKK